MARALFFNVPGHGHVTPSLPLVAELVQRGHQVTYFITPRFRADVEATGADFRAYRSVGDGYFDAPGMSNAVPMNTAYELIRSTEEMLPELLEIGRSAQPDYILFDGMCPWGYYVACILGLPAVASLSLMPLTSPPPRAMLNPDMLRVMLPMLLRRMGRGLAAHRRSAALGRKHGVALLSLPQIINATGDLSLSYTSSYFQPYAETVDSSVRFVGWTLSETPSDAPFSFKQAAGRQLVYVSLGTLHAGDAAFFRACVDAFAGSNSFVVMSTGGRISPEAFGAPPENIVIHPWVPQTEILKRAALFVTHAGLSSVHDGLYLGLPLLLVPQQGEQAVIAQRVVELGAGLMLRKSRTSAETIRAAALRLLSEPGFQAEAARIGETFRAAGGAARGADEIDALLRKGARNA